MFHLHPVPRVIHEHPSLIQLALMAILKYDGVDPRATADRLRAFETEFSALWHNLKRNMYGIVLTTRFGDYERAKKDRFDILHQCWEMA